MKVNHLNLCVPDVPETARFFEEHFGLVRISPKTTETLSVLTDEGGFILVLSNFDKKVAPEYPDGFHFGFIQETKEEVDRIYERLSKAGFAQNAPRSLHGSWTFYFNAPGNIVVEVQCLLDR